MVEPERLLIRANGWMPNNEHLPTLVWRGVFAKEVDGGPMAAAMEREFLQNGWPAQWRNGIYSFHHYHSTAHEVLGIAGGQAKLVLGGEGGPNMSVKAGDVLLLPAGTGHCRTWASPDFLVVGAYPEGEHWDICREAPTPEMRARMAQVPFGELAPTGDTMRSWWR